MAFLSVLNVMHLVQRTYRISSLHVSTIQIRWVLYLSVFLFVFIGSESHDSLVTSLIKMTYKLIPEVMRQRSKLFSEFYRIVTVCAFFVQISSSGVE
jgi:hypothetical protein